MIDKLPVTKAILLAAGRGDRLKPHTDSTPKPLLVHRGKPTLDYILDSLLAAGVDDVVLVAHHLAEQIEQYALLRSAGQSQRIRVAYQAMLAGTAHALESAIDQYPDIIEQPCVLSATDYVVPRPFFVDLLSFHAEHEAELTVSLKALKGLSDTQLRSRVRFVDDGSIVEIVEKPQNSGNADSVGANLSFVLPPSIVHYIEDVAISPRGEREIQQAINNWIRQGGTARGLLQAAPLEWKP